MYTKGHDSLEDVGNEPVAHHLRVFDPRIPISLVAALLVAQDASHQQYDEVAQVDVRHAIVEPCNCSAIALKQLLVFARRIASQS